MQTKSKIGPLVLLVALLAAAGVFGDLTPGGQDRNPPPSYKPGEGERPYSIQIGAASTWNRAKAKIIINGDSHDEILYGGESGESGDGPGVFVRGFDAKFGTPISITVTRVGNIQDRTRDGTISCYIREDGKEKSGQSTDNVYANSVSCAWIVGTDIA